MALKNTYTKLPANRHIQMAMEALIKAGASGIQSFITNGKTTGIAFTIELKGITIQFKLPVNWEKFQHVLAKEGNRRATEDEYCYRVAWACTADWIEAQMAFIESENVTVTQVFLPYAVTDTGETLFEKVASKPEFLLGSGK